MTKIMVLLLCFMLQGCMPWMYVQPWNCLIHIAMGVIPQVAVAEVSGDEALGMGAAVAVGLGKELIDPVITPIDLLCTVLGGGAAYWYRTQ